MTTDQFPTIHVDVEPGWRGGQRQVLLLCRGLARRGHPVTLVARRGGELAGRAEAAGIEVIGVGGRGEADLAGAQTLVRLIRERRPAVVGLHSSRSHGLGSLVRLFLGRQRPRFVVTRRVDFAPRKDLLNRYKYRHGADGYLAISMAIMRVLVAAGVPKSRIRIVHSGVEPPMVQPGAGLQLRRKLDIDESTPLIGIVASLTDHKGHRYLLEAMPAVLAAFPDAVLLLVGDGELREELENRATTLGINGSGIRFLGHRPDVPSILKALDLFVMSSHMEGLCTSIIDAMLGGVPVVATGAGGIPELVEHGTTGLLAEVRSARSLASRIISLLADLGLGRRLAAQAEQAARNRFTADAMVEGSLAAYREFAG